VSADNIPNVIQVGDPFSERVDEVRVNGRRIGKVFYINRRKGLVRAFVEPLQFDKHKKRLLVKTFYGQVEVVTRG